MKIKHIVQLIIIPVLLLIALLIMYVLHKQTREVRPETVKYDPIGLFYTNLDDWDKVPRQGKLAQHIKGHIELFDEYLPALYTLKDFEYIIVTYHFHLIKDWDEEMVPPGAVKSRGIFATRSPYRPNPIGITVCHLDSIRENKIYLSGVDAFDNTPVLDIKPYLPSVDCVEDAKKDMEKSLGIDSLLMIDSVPGKQ